VTIAMATKSLPAVQHAGSSCTCHRWISASARPHQNSYCPISGHLTGPT